MTRYRDDRYDDRNMRDDRRSEDRRFDRDDDRSRYSDDRSGMGMGSGMDRGRMGQGSDRDRDGDMGYGYGASGRSYGQDYGQRQTYGSGQYDRDRGMSGDQGYGSQGYGDQGRGMGGMFSDQYRDDRQYQGGMSGGRSQGGQYQGSQYQGSQSGGSMVYSAGMGGGMSSGYSQGASMGQGQSSGQSGMTGYRGRGPKGYQRSDDRIRDEVNDALEDEDGVDASNIEVQVQGGEVTLTGTVTDRQQKRRAEECVENLRGVRDVHNQLRVQREGQSGMGQGGTMGQGSTTVIAADPDNQMGNDQSRNR